jgi:hypothetical protein
MTVADLEERLKKAARSFTNNDNTDTMAELRVASYGYRHWQRELEKAKKREGTR